MSFYRHFELASGLLMFGLLAAAALVSCAAPSQSASPKAARSRGQEAAQPPRLAELREEFDPEPYRDDGFLIQPEFGRPVSTASIGPPSPALELEQPTTEPDTASTGMAETVAPLSGAATVSSTVYRVQVMALSNEEAALTLADALRQRVTAPVSVRRDGELFVVRAGESTSPTVAEALRVRIVGLGSQYAEAYVVAEQVAVAGTWDDGSEFPNDVPLDLPPPDDAAAAAAVELVRTSGWRVLLDQFESYQQATSFRQSALRRLQRNGIDAAVEIVFAAPRYKVLVGNFRTSGEAQELTERVVGLGYRNALKVRDEVYLPREEN